MENNKPKLTEAQRLIAVRMAAEFMSFSEVTVEIKRLFNIEVDPTSIRDIVHTNKWKPHYQKFRNEFLSKVKEIPIANKRIRLDDLEMMRGKLVEQIKSSGSKIHQGRCFRRLGEVLSLAREEVERRPQLIAGLQIGDFSDQSDEELIARRDRLLKELGVATPATADRDVPDPEGTGSEDEPEPS